MQIQVIQPQISKINNVETRPSFKSTVQLETLKHCNIGMMKNGYIGKIKTIKPTGEEVFLNVFKHAGYLKELYFIKDDAEQIIGEIELKIRKAQDYDKLAFPSDPSHVFIENLRNYSNPRTPFYRKGLEEYKGIGTKLIQIAQRRSDEALCNGNLELISKFEAFDFYYKLGFEKTEQSLSGYPHKLYLPPMAKEPLSKLQGGL